MARTVDVLSGGRVVLGIGAGWFERDYREYGFEFPTAASRLRELDEGIVRIRRRLARLDPPPSGRLPVLVGGGGARVTLRIVAERANAWNTFGPLDVWRAKNGHLDRWCERVGRDPAEIERTVTLVDAAEVDDVDGYVAAGVDHVILGCPPPYDFTTLRRLLAIARR